MKDFYDIAEYEEYYRSRDPLADRVILHSDLNNFFASVESLSAPNLKEVPLAVCGDVEARHGIVLAKNEIAKKYGIKTGDTVGDAKRKCPHIVITATHYSEYVKYSRLVREIYMHYATRIEPFGIDEAWIDISDLARLKGENIFLTGKAIADEIRERTKSELGLTISVGVSFNKTFAKLASDMKKPDAVTLIPYSNFKEIIWNMPVSDLLFVGRSTQKTLKLMKITTIGDLAGQKRAFIKKVLGKFGESLWDRANGYDLSPVAYYHNDDGTKSISNSTTTPRDLTTAEEVASVLTPLSESVTEQLRARRIMASTVRLFIKYSDFTSVMRQTKILPTNSTEEVFRVALSLYTKNADMSMPIRSVGVGVEDFTDAAAEQQNIFDLHSALDDTLDSLRARYGDRIIKRGSVMKNSILTDFDKRHVAFNSNI